jgi:hypothetical protein
MDISRPKFLAFARKLALLTSTVAPTLVACASAPPPVNNPSPVSTTAPAATVADPSGDPGAPSRCSWDTNASAAPRVCKKGEMHYDGERCVPASHSGEEEGGPIMKGPLPPPDLPSLV